MKKQTKRKISFLCALAVVGSSMTCLTSNASISNDMLNPGDVNEDVIVNAIDASMVLTEYASLATGKNPSFTTLQIYNGDVNNDGVIDAIDASTILSYYAFDSTGGNGSLENYIDSLSDADGDGLSNDIEAMLGTSSDSDDTDGDGLSDTFEFNYLLTDLNLQDTDNNDISDYDEDYDSDGLSNGKEQELNSRPDKADTDSDGIPDGEEVNVYGSDLLNSDTDSDGIIDGDEIILGLDMTKAKTDGITIDSERTFEQTTDESILDDQLIASDNWLKPSISGNVAGLINKNVALEASDNTAFTSNRSVLSDVIDVTSSYDNLTLSFNYEAEYTGNIDNLTIVSYKDDELAIVETAVDIENKTISGEISEDATYFVIDVDEFLKGLGIDVMANVQEASTLGVKKAIEPSAAAASKFSSETALGKADIVFVIDTTGSMSSTIYNVQENIVDFTDKLSTDYNVDVNFSLIEYRDIYEDGVDSTILHKNMSSGWFTNVEVYKNAINSLTVDGGGDAPETPIDALEMARNSDWRSDTSKFVILVTDADYKNANSSGIEDMTEMTNLFVKDNINVSSICYSESIYSELTDATDGLYGYIYGNFSEVLLGLADKIGIATNEDGDWVLLKNYEAVQLSGKIDEIAKIDSDNDGLTDKQELVSTKEVDLSFLVKFYLQINNVPEELYNGKTSVTVWNHISNPVLPDTDYDGIDDPDDTNKKNNDFTGIFHYKEDKKFLTSKNDVEFTVDYSKFFNDNTVYREDLAVYASLLASDAYTNTYIELTSGAEGGSDSATEMGTIFGLSDVTDYKIYGSDYNDDDDDDNTEFIVGHRTVVHNGLEKEIVVVSVRGTNGTNSEWSSNFDVGADTTEYYNACGSKHPYWKDKAHHKGFDVAANRVLEKLNSYLSAHSIETGTIFITGHSRGAAIANIVGKHFHDNSNFRSLTYTFATPNNTTVDTDTALSYDTIFNIINTDDLIPYLPLTDWGFTKYGTEKRVSVEDKLENKKGTREKGTWEWLIGKDYNNDGGTQRTITAFGQIAENREEVYKLDTTDDGKVWEKNLGRLNYDKIVSDYDTLVAELEDEKLLRFCNVSITDGPIYHVEVNYCPAYLMQSLANMTTRVGPLLGHDVNNKYAEAKTSFVASSGKLKVAGGMTHPHEPITYYLIAYNNIFS